MKAKRANWIVCIAPWGASVLALACADAKETLTPLSYEQPQAVQRFYEIRIRNVCAETNFRFQDIYALHSSARIEDGGLMIDLDRDGLSNNHEIEVGTTYNVRFDKADTNLDGYSDLLAERGGFTLDEQKKFKRCLQVAQDTDLDDLTDCEENNLTHTDPMNPDSDLDGIPDGLEVRFGLNPKADGDSIQDLDNDGIDNYQEIKANTSATETNSEYMQYLALQYTIEHQDRSDAECLNVTIGNIPIVNASNGNQIILYFLERNAANQNRMTRAAVIFTDHEEEESLEVEYADLEKTSN